MNDREIICYMLGSIGDVTRDEAIEALKNYTNLNEQEINNIIDEVIEFNNSSLQKYRE
jgi:ABC-type polysaccharide/polyol phosphate transport system ATPase subunit|tara:strand:+ start:278 stop:451 length:174 start_codon:yes stop_codon:yes gene_type:complete